MVSVQWWQRNRSRFRPYILGEACWDNVYTAVMMCHSDGVLLNRDPLILHERHAAAWRDTTPEARYNGLLAALDARYFDLWSQYWHRLEATASPQRHGDEERLVRDIVRVEAVGAGCAAAIHPRRSARAGAIAGCGPSGYARRG